MATWWISLSLIMKVLWGLTLTATLIFVIQSILTFIGADIGDTGLDGDFDMSDVTLDSGMNLYTFRNFINFFMGFGWTAILLHDSIRSTALLLFISTLVGVALVAMVMYLFKLLSRMQQSGNIDLFKSAVGCTGRVYLTVPGGRDGSGKVQININGSVREYDAFTDGEMLPNGTAIKVTEVIDSSTLLVVKQ